MAQPRRRWKASNPPRRLVPAAVEVKQEDVISSEAEATSAVPDLGSAAGRTVEQLAVALARPISVPAAVEVQH